MAMRLRKLTRPDRRMEQRILLIVELGRRRDRLLETPNLDLDALAVLAADYEAAGLPHAAADLRRRLEWYRGGKM
jgi:hypothetical protein